MICELTLNHATAPTLSIELQIFVLLGIRLRLSKLPLCGVD